MGLETAIYIKDLVTTNPLFNDDFNKGDDHLRLIKSVLKGHFSGLAGESSSQAITVTSAQFNTIPKAILTDDSKTPGMTVAFLSNVLGSSGTLGGSFKSQINVNQSDGSLSAAPAAGVADLTLLHTASSGESYGLYADAKVTGGATNYTIFGRTRGEGTGAVVGVTGRAEQASSGAAYGVEGVVRRVSADPSAFLGGALFGVTTHINSAQNTTGVIILNQNAYYSGSLPTPVDSPTRALHILGNTVHAKSMWDDGIVIEHCTNYGIWQRLQEATFGEILDHKYWWSGGGLYPSAPSDTTCLLIRSGDWSTYNPGIPLVDYGIQVNGTFDYAAIRVLSEQGIAFDNNGRYQIRYQTYLGAPSICFWDRIRNVVVGYVRMNDVAATVPMN